MVVAIAMCAIPAYATGEEESVHSHMQAVEAYMLINQRVALSMDEDVCESDLTRIDDKLNDMGVREVSFTDVVTDIGHELGYQLMSDYPNPGSNDKVRFYSVYDYLDDGQQIYCLICAPYENSSHSGNKTTGVKTLTSYVDSGAITVVDVSGNLKNAENIVSNVSVRTESLYDIFSDFLSNSTGQVSKYTAEMRTRTVTMFVYSKNTADNVVYYGSTNCVHTYIDHTVTKNATGSPLRAATTSDLILAEDYYDFAVNVVGANPSGYGVVAKHSYVSGVLMKVGGKSALTQGIPCYSTLIQATN